MNTKREFWQRNAMAVIGMLIFSAGINLFIVPANLYNGGVLGISQVLRTVLVRYLHVAAGTTADKTSAKNQNGLRYLFEHSN